LDEVEKKVDVEGLSVVDDEDLPKPPEHENDESAFDNILKSFNIGIEHSEITVSVLTKTPIQKRKRKEWSRRSSRQVSPTKEQAALDALNRQSMKATSVVNADVTTVRDESVIGDNQITELERTIADVFKMINKESNNLGEEFQEKMEGFNKTTENLITSVKTKKAKAKAKRYSKTPQVQLKL